MKSVLLPIKHGLTFNIKLSKRWIDGGQPLSGEKPFALPLPPFERETAEEIGSVRASVKRVSDLIFDLTLWVSGSCW